MNWEHTTQFVGQILTYVGLPAILAMLLYIGRKLQILDDIRDSVKNHLEPEMQDVRARLMVVEKRVGTLWEDRLSSPIDPSKKYTR